eukprot:3180096-Amphidinium_carterae.1
MVNMCFSEYIGPKKHLPTLFGHIFERLGPKLWGVGGQLGAAAFEQPHPCLAGGAAAFGQPISSWRRL